jgi:protein-tyrosine-phosphatase
MPSRRYSRRLSVRDDRIGALARRHAALGDPIRIALIEHLLVTDASPGELAAVHDLPTNVLAHHVTVLHEAGIVRRLRSEGDARRTYLHLRTDDPWIRCLSATWAPSPPPSYDRVVFVCTQNSARSQLAAALWPTVSGLPVASAGTRPAPRVHPRTVTTGQRHGLWFDTPHTHDLTDVARPDDLVVCVCDNAHEELLAHPEEYPPTAQALHWSVVDPVPADTDEAFDLTHAELTGRVARLADILTTTEPAPGP